MKSLPTRTVILTVILTLIGTLVHAQQISTTFKPFVKQPPSRVLIRESNDGNYLVFGDLESYGDAILGKVVKVDEHGVASPSFQKTIFDARVSNIRELPSGKILVAGAFSKLNGQEVPHLIQLNSNGSVDNSFSADPTLNIVGLAIQSTGKIIVVIYTNPTGYSLKRLNTDGTTDNSFDTGPISINGFWQIDIDVNDRIYYSSLGMPFYRFTPDGPRDNAFSFAHTDIQGINAFALLPNGLPIVGVSRILSLSPYKTANTLVRANDDGSIDNTFIAPEADASIYGIVLRGNGKIAVDGYYSNFNGSSSIGAIIELNSDGSYNQTIAKSDFNGMDGLVEDSHGNLFPTGRFKTINNVPSPFVAKIKPDKTIDTEFSVPTYSNGGSFYIPFAIQSGSRLLVGGGFDFMGIENDKSKLVRLKPDGSVDATFVADLRKDQNNIVNPAVYALAVQEDDKIIVGGSRIFQNQTSFGRLLPNGAADNTFKIGTGPDTNFGVPSISHVVYKNSKIYVFGRFETFNGRNSPALAILDKDGNWIGPTQPALNINTYIVDVELQNDGKILLLGSTIINGSNDNLVRLNADGSADNTFHVTIQGNTGDITLDDEGNIWAVGSLLDLVNGRSIVKLDPNGVRLPNPPFSNAISGGNTIQYLAGGKLAIGGAFTTFNGITTRSLAIIDMDGQVLPTNINFEKNSHTSRMFSHNDVLYTLGRYSENNASEISTVRKILPDITNATNFSASSASAEKITLSWTGPFSGAERVELEQSPTNESNYQKILDLHLFIQSHAVTGLTEATKYYFRVKASNEIFNGTPLVASATTLIKPAVALVATGITTNSFIANWEYLAGTDSVVLQLSHDNFTNFSETILKNASLELTNLDVSKHYEYRMKRYRNGLASEVSSTIMVTLVPQAVVKENQIITFTEIANKTLGQTPFPLNATASSSLSVSFSSTSDKISLTGSQVTLVKAGRATVKANQSGNDNFNAAPAVERSFCINPAKPVITAANTVLTSSSDAGNQWYVGTQPIATATSKTYTATQSGTYTVKVTAEECVSELSSPVEIVITGIEEANTIGINVYPNPADDRVVVETSGLSEGKCLIQFTDVVGKVVLSRESKLNHSEAFEMSQNSSGIYFVTVNHNGVKSVKKIVVR